MTDKTMNAKLIPVAALKDRRLIVRTDAALYQELERAAHLDRRSISQFVRLAIEERIEKITKS